MISLLKMMVQDQSEASSSRIITAFTTMSARRNMETMEKLPTTSPAGALLAPTPGGGASAWDSAAGPVGAAIGPPCPCAQTGPESTGAATRTARIRSMAVMNVFMEKPFGARQLRGGESLMRADLG